MNSAVGETAAGQRQPIPVDLALQGGGSHGAFTWGVLDRLLEEPWIRIDAISGTSAGAMNAAVLADGWSRGGADGASAIMAAARTPQCATEGAFLEVRARIHPRHSDSLTPPGALLVTTSRLSAGRS